MKLKGRSMRITAVILAMVTVLMMNLVPVSAKVVLPGPTDAKYINNSAMQMSNYLTKMASQGMNSENGTFIPIPYSVFVPTAGDPIPTPGPLAPVNEGVDLSPHPELGNQFLAEMGIVDVTAAPFNIDNTGATDVTQKLQDALNYGRKNQLAVFLPSGTYLISDTLHIQNGISARMQTWMTFVTNKNEMPTVLIGSTKGSGAKIKLADGAPGFNDPLNGKAVIHYYQPDIVKGTTTTIGWGGAHGSDQEGNIVIDHINVETGVNPGAIGIHMASAQGGVLENVTINATGALCGIMGGSGNGGSWSNITVTGGKIGYDSRTTTILLPSIQNMTLQNQTHLAWFAGTGGSNTVAGLRIIADYAGPAILKMYRGQPYFGSINLIDAEIIYNTAYNGAAIAGTMDNRNIIDTLTISGSTGSADIPAASDVPKALYLNNVYFKNVATAIYGDKYPGVVGNLNGWFQIKEFATGRDETWNSVNWKNPVYVNGTNIGNTYLGETTRNVAPPSDLELRHGWTQEQVPNFEADGIVNVKTAYGVVGNGVADDTAALQQAINEHDLLFLPKGYYRISSTLKLKPNTKLIGLCSAYTYIYTQIDDIPKWAANSPLVETADTAEGNTVISNITITPTKEVPKSYSTNDLPIYSVKWQSGSNSIMHTVQIEPTRTLGFIGSDNPDTYNIKYAKNKYPLLLITGNGGGKIYNVYAQLYLAALYTNEMRLLAIRGTRNPLAIYATNWEYSKTMPAVEVSNSRYVTFYGSKTEENVTYMEISDSDHIRIFGHSGSGTAPYNNVIKPTATSNPKAIFNASGKMTGSEIPDPIDPTLKGSLFKVSNTPNFMITNINDQVTVTSGHISNEILRNPYFLFYPLTVDENSVPSDARPSMYKTGNPIGGFEETTATIQARDAGGNRSTNGPSITVTTLKNDTVAPTWPDKNITVTGVTSNSLTLNWNPAYDANGTVAYAVYRTGFTPVLLGNVTSYNLTGLAANTDYSIRIEACDAAGNWSAMGPSRIVGTDKTLPVWNGSIAVSNVNANSGKLTWTAATDNLGVVAYVIYKNGSLVANAPGNATSYTVTGLTPSTTYNFTVYAMDAVGNQVSKTASFATTADTTVPAWSGTASIAVANRTQTQATLTWLGASDNIGVTQYKVYTNGMNPIPVSGTSYTVTGLTADTTYSFKVEAGDAAGNWTTNGPSTTVSTDTTTPVWTSGTVTESNKTQTGITLNWSGADDKAGVTAYRVIMNGVLQFPTIVGETCYDVTGLTADTTYTFKVEAVDAAGNWTTNGPGITISTDITAPVWINGTVRESNKTQTGVTLSWSGASDNKGVAAYAVYKDGSLLATVTEHLYPVTGLAGNTTYTFTIEAIDAAGNCSTNGPSITVFIDTLAPTWTDGSLAASNVEQTALTLNWNEASDNVGVTGYKVYQGNTLIAALGNVTSYDVTSLDVRTDYTFRVEAGDAAGNWSTTGPSVTVSTLSVGGGNNRDKDKEKDNNKDKEKEKYNNSNK